MKIITRIMACLLLLAVSTIPAFALLIGFAYQVLAETTADVTVNATPAYIAITSDQNQHGFGVVAESATPSTSTSWATIDNTSSVQTDQTIGVTATTWSSSGNTWAHAEDGVPGNMIAGLKANRGGTWGVGDIVVRNASPLYIYENCPPITDYSFGLKLWAPTVFTDGAEKTITVRVSAAPG